MEKVTLNETSPSNTLQVGVATQTPKISVICCWASVAVMSYVAIATIPERSLDRLIDALDVEVQFRVLPVAGATIVHACFEQMLHQGPWN